MLDWRLYPDFNSGEFDDGGPEIHPDFMQRLQRARQICRQLCLDAGVDEVKFVINSGSRSEEKNRQVGGKPDSTHLYGVACDIRAMTSRQSFFIVKALLLAGFTRIGVYKTFIHVDEAALINEIRNTKSSNVLWKK